MPCVPGDSKPTRPPGELWKYYDRGVFSQSEVVFGFLDTLGDDDIIVEVSNLSENHRGVLLSFLRSISIEDIPPGLFIGRIRDMPEFDREWQLYRQKKAHVILSSFGSENLAEDD